MEYWDCVWPLTWCVWSVWQTLWLWALTVEYWDCVQCMTDIMTVGPDCGVLKLCVTTDLMCVECLMDSVGSWCGARNWASLGLVTRIRGQSPNRASTNDSRSWSTARTRNLHNTHDNDNDTNLFNTLYFPPPSLHQLLLLPLSLEKQNKRTDDVERKKKKYTQ